MNQFPPAAIDHVTVGRRSAGRRLLGSATPFLFLLPALALVGILLLYPFARSAYLSFTDYKGIGAANWVGLDNYRNLARDPVLSRTLTNTMLWVVGTLILPVGLGLLVAVLSYNAKAGSILRLPFLIPYALSGTAIATVWQFMLIRDGALNNVLDAIGLSSLARPWLLNPPLNTWSMIIASTWQAVGVSVLLFLIGLQVIPPEPIQAARLDGADGWRLFRDMTLPMLAPMTIVVVGISLVNSLKTFDIVWIMTQGGPYRSSETLAVMMYRETFVLFKHGYGAAIAVMLSVIVLAVSLVYLNRTLRNT
ncbi:MAG: sugar ABC transporter permease [Thermomicrobiales bacterium]|nr:sugar ABC transporter permease [Thermomicrobiales bacterium]MCO5221966.1 sugar ABC transporter permease [Thermomicrobiales bacterium]